MGIVDDVMEGISQQAKALAKVIFDTKPEDPTTNLQKRIHVIQRIIGKILSTIIYGLILVVPVWYLFQQVYPFQVDNGDSIAWSVIKWVSGLAITLALKAHVGWVGLLIIPILLIIYLWSLRYAIVFTTFVNRYKLFAIIGIWSTILFIRQSTPRLFGTKTFSEMGRVLLEMLKKAGGGG
jgi:hypothetical protein